MSPRPRLYVAAPKARISELRISALCPSSSRRIPVYSSNASHKESIWTLHGWEGLNQYGNVCCRNLAASDIDHHFWHYHIIDHIAGLVEPCFRKIAQGFRRIGTTAWVGLYPYHKFVREVHRSWLDHTRGIRGSYYIPLSSIFGTRG